mgnify:CR=1 FL=1
MKIYSTYTWWSFYCFKFRLSLVLFENFYKIVINSNFFIWLWSGTIKSLSIRNRRLFFLFYLDFVFLLNFWYTNWIICYIRWFIRWKLCSLTSLMDHWIKINKTFIIIPSLPCRTFKMFRLFTFNSSFF